MIVGALLMIVGGIVVYKLVPTGFLPEIDEGAFVIDYYTPGGTALVETDRMVHIAEDILLKTPEVAGASIMLGSRPDCGRCAGSNGSARPA